MQINVYFAVITAVLTYFIGIYVGHDVGTYRTEFRIAKQCALDNSFTEHGNEFYCQDIDDYRAN